MWWYWLVVLEWVFLPLMCAQGLAPQSGVNSACSKRVSEDFHGAGPLQ